MQTWHRLLIAAQRRSQVNVYAFEVPVKSDRHPVHGRPTGMCTLVCRAILVLSGTQHQGDSNRQCKLLLQSRQITRHVVQQLPLSIKIDSCVAGFQSNQQRVSTGRSNDVLDDERLCCYVTI